jgi:hypothetical protein
VVDLSLLERPRVHEPADAEALFKEARQRRRRRRLVAGAIFIALAAGLALGLLMTQGNGNGGGRGASRPGHGRSPSNNVATGPATPANSSLSVALPRGYRFSQVLSKKGQLYVAGEVASASHNRPDQSTPCVLAPVSPKTLKVGSAVHSNCDNPAMTGQLVAPINSRTQSYSSAQVSIAVLNPRTGSYSTGPPVIAYSPSSTSSPVYAYGGNWLWLYDVATTAGPQLLQINAQTGAVVNTIGAPQLFDPLMAANDDGLWLANSFKGSPAPYVLYHAIPGRSQLTGVLLGPNLHAYWLTASGRHAWLGAGSLPTVQTLWRFDGTDATIGLDAPITGFQPFGQVVGDETAGLWTVVADPPLSTSALGQIRGKPLAVIRINATTGIQQVMARGPALPALEEAVGLSEGESIFYRGSFFVLEPSGQLSQGFTRLTRVTP